MDLLQKFRQHCASSRLVRPGDRLLLAVSGGLDSRVMLDLFCRLRDQWQEQKQWQLAVAHINHQIRGHEADEDEMFVKVLAEAANLPFFSQRVDAPAYAQAHRLSLETAARTLRYQALEQFRKNWQGRVIVTAHTLDDQAETILDHLLRGSGLAGLAGMAALTDMQLGFHHEKFVVAPSPPRILKTNERRSGAGAVLSSKSEPLKGKLQTKVLRPLLAFSRERLEKYARSHQLNWREDRTNIDPQFRRNRIRHELMPLLKTRFNPQIARSLERLAVIAGAADDYLHAEAETALSKVIKETQPDKIILDIEQFWKYFEIVQRYVIRAVIQRLVNAQVEPTFSETARILALMQRPDVRSRSFAKRVLGRRFIWRQQIEVAVDHDGVVFERQKAKSKEQKASAFLVAVTIGERCSIPGTEMALLVERKDLPPEWRQQAHSNSQFVDAGKVAGNLIIRFPKPGDRFMPLRVNATAGSSGSKKLSDFFTDLKVPLHRRRVIPVLECGDIVWVCGYRLDDRFKITPATKTVLHLQLLRVSPV